MEYITIQKCQRGTVYKLSSRNLHYGVYDGDEGFIGIRQKFGDFFLFTEYHYDQGAPFGTAKPLKEVTQLPEGITIDSDFELFTWLQQLETEQGLERSHQPRSMKEAMERRQREE